MPLHTWLLFATAYLITTISPGPNVLLVIRNTLRYGRAGTAPTIAGNLLSQLVVVVLVALGVGAVLAAMPPLFLLMKVMGAAYLMYLGIKQLRGGAGSAATAATAPAAPALNRGKIFREAVLVSGSNPKTLIFLSAFMPQFISHDRPLAGQFAIMYLTVAATVATVHTVYSLGVRGMAARHLPRRWNGIVKRASGLLFVGLGVKLLLTKRA
ncbi:LysE family translocator [Amantichitinum ursilacus]|uniref:Homoserine/homoserine lactone efflux protein n=1 Tax=Amantichitinum ursilacus TaxID=857265 RepID=A0A0N0GL22_9NEIS|nr:LysE family translocator [Amantichitinum ursilacus]KPC49644.1 Homoserine/homoserine lactone efflux protein [Amantichitinum ursilacus]